MKNFNEINSQAQEASNITHKGIKHASGHLPNREYHIVKVENGWELRNEEGEFVAFTDKDPKTFRKEGYNV